MISFSGRIFGFATILFFAGCSGDQPTAGTATSTEELAAFIEDNPSFAGEANSVPVPSTANPKEKETSDTLELGN